MSNQTEYNFKVGDEVITSTGQVGVIEDICDCEYCKERGFCEPQVETKIGNGTIYITDNDKRVNFRSFYKIGDYVFGNIDKESLLYNMICAHKKLDELAKQIEAYNLQLGVIFTLEQEISE